MNALLIGTALALVSLAFVLYPLFRESPVRRTAPERSSFPEETAAQRAIGALREVEFDRETGKLSDSDYTALKAAYTREALTALRSEEASAAASAVGDDEVEAVILKYRSRVSECSSCGPRPEPDAAYCSNCGRYLAGACSGCGARITESGARFCPACGQTLAA